MQTIISLCYVIIISSPIRDNFMTLTVKTRVGSCAQLHATSPPPRVNVTVTATSPKLSHKQAIILRLIFTSWLQSEHCSHLSRNERATSPHFLDCDAPDGAARGARVPAGGEPEGLGVLPTVVSDRTAMPHSADRHNKTTSRPTQKHTPLLRTTPHGRSGGHRPPPRLPSPTPLPSSQPPPVGRRASCIYMRWRGRPLVGRSSSWLMLLTQISQAASCRRLNESFFFFLESSCTQRCGLLHTSDPAAVIHLH